MITFLILCGLVLFVSPLLYNSDPHMHAGCTKFLGLWNRNHVQDRGYYCNVPGYGTIHDRGTDGVRRKHGAVFVRCARCDEEFNLVMVHQHKYRIES